MPRRLARLGLSAMVLLCGVLLCGGFQALSAASFHPDTFQTPSGAVVLNSGGNYVEPYFATKALIVAQDAGLDVHQAAAAWIDWALPRQLPNGLFRRFCSAEGKWRDCAPADADDSILALWMQLLYRMAPPTGMPAGWQRSVALSAKQLDKLYNRRLGVYYISTRNHVALLMDNVEVYAALKDIAQAQERLHDRAASSTNARAEHLHAAIERIFWDRHSRRFRASIQKERLAFYPDAVAQVYPWLADMSGPDQDAREAWGQWKRDFGAGWMERQYDIHPWGLVALAAEKVGDRATAACWTSKSGSLRGSSSWNVLEEAAWQSLRAQFSQEQLLNPQTCSEMLAKR